MKWWQQLLSGNQWAYDVSQPPLVYTGKVGGKTHRVVSVATMEGVWFAFDAKTGQPFHERVKVIDRVEHPPLRPGQPVTVFPSSLGGLNYSPAAYDPATNYVFNAAAETAAVMIQQKLTPTQKKRKFLLGDVYLGLQNGNFGTALPELARPRLDQRDRRVDRPPRLEVHDARARARRRVVTASGPRFRGRRRRRRSARSTLKTGKVLWTFNTERPIASGPTIFSADGKEYVAVTVGGTPTSSNGGVASLLQVFALAGRAARRALDARAVGPHAGDDRRRVGAPRRARRRRARPPRTPRIAIAGRRRAARALAGGELERGDGRRPRLPRRQAGRRRARAPSTASPSSRRPTRSGGFAANVDATLARRHPVRVVDASRATRRRTPLTRRRAERAAGGERRHFGRLPRSSA